ncbi:hypothetical protein CL622_04720 [archaeon]|nr:hypothetical protein [archaeon]
MNGRLWIMASILLLSCTFVSAQSLLAELSLDKSTFEPGDVVDITLELRNIADQSQAIEIHGITFAELDGSAGLIRDVEDTLASDEIKLYHVYTITVPEDYEEGVHTVSVIILSGLGAPIELQQEFHVENTLRPLDVELVSCQLDHCDSKRSVYTLNQDISLDYQSLTPEIKITATMEQPDGSVKKISFPLTTQLDQLGLYTLSLTASKKGYLSVSKTYYLSALKSLPSYKTEDDRALTAYGYGTPASDNTNQPKGLDLKVEQKQRNIFSDLLDKLRGGVVGQAIRTITGYAFINKGK